MPPTKVFFLPEKWAVGAYDWSDGATSAPENSLGWLACKQPRLVKLPARPLRTAVAFVDIPIQGIITIYLFFTIRILVIFLFYIFSDIVLTCISPDLFPDLHKNTFL